MGKHKKTMLVKKTKNLSLTVVKKPVEDKVELASTLNTIELVYAATRKELIDTYTSFYFEEPTEDDAAKLAALAHAISYPYIRTNQLIQQCQGYSDLCDQCIMINVKSASLRGRFGLFTTAPTDPLYAKVIEDFEEVILITKKHLRKLTFSHDVAFQEEVSNALDVLRNHYEKIPKAAALLKELEYFSYDFGLKCGRNIIRVKELYYYFSTPINSKERIYDISSKEKRDFNTLLDEVIGQKIKTINAHKANTFVHTEATFNFVRTLIHAYRFRDITGPRSIWPKVQHLPSFEAQNTFFFDPHHKEMLLLYYKTFTKMQKELLLPAIEALRHIDMAGIRENAELCEDVRPLFNEFVRLLKSQLLFFNDWLKVITNKNEKPAEDPYYFTIQEEILYLKSLIIDLYTEENNFLPLLHNNHALHDVETARDKLKQDKAALAAQKKEIDDERKKIAKAYEDEVSAWQEKTAASFGISIQGTQTAASHNTIDQATEMTGDETADFITTDIISIPQSSTVSHYHDERGLAECDALYNKALLANDATSKLQAMDGKVFIFGNILLPKITKFDNKLAQRDNQKILPDELVWLENTFEELSENHTKFLAFYNQYQQLIATMAHNNIISQTGIDFALLCLTELKAKLETRLKSALILIVKLRDQYIQRKREFIFTLGYESLEKQNLLNNASIEDINAEGEKRFAAIGIRKKQRDIQVSDDTIGLRVLTKLAKNIGPLLNSCENLPNPSLVTITEIPSFEVNQLLEALEKIFVMATKYERYAGWESTLFKLAESPFTLNDVDREKIYARLREYFVKTDPIVYVQLLAHYKLLNPILGTAFKHGYVNSAVWMLEKKINLVNPFKKPIYNGLWTKSAIDKETHERIKPFLGNPFFKKDKKEKDAREMMVEGLDLPRVVKR